MYLQLPSINIDQSQPKKKPAHSEKTKTTKIEGRPSDWGVDCTFDTK